MSNTVHDQVSYIIASQNFSNMLVCTSLWCVYHMTEAVKADELTHYGW